MMEKWKKILVNKSHTIIETMQIIEETSRQFAVVVDDNEQLLGTITDGDIRRGILKGISFEESICRVMNEKPIVIKKGEKEKNYKDLMKRKNLRQLPVVNENNIVVDIIFLEDFYSQNQKDNIVVLMAGGLGARLRPLTNHTPKPMLNVGSKPILETIIEGFNCHGYKNFIICVNYKKEIIKEYFQDGRKWNVQITYIEEQKKLGTAGALSLLNKNPEKPIFVMNGDLLTQVNFEQLMQFHEENEASATMCVREYEYQIPYGVIETEGQQLMAIKEKPMHKSFVNAGIYVLSPEVFDCIPKNEFYDMPELFSNIIAKNKKTVAFPVREYWLDIGQMADFERANEDYKE